MSNIISLDEVRKKKLEANKDTDDEFKNVPKKAVAFFFSPIKTSDDQQQIETPIGPAYIRAQVTNATDLADVFDHLKYHSDYECFMNGHWVFITAGADHAS